MPKLTPLQWLGIALVVNGALIGSTAQLNDILGPSAAKIIVSIASIGNSIFGGIVTMLSGQGSLVKSVAAMPGIESIRVNSAASQTLAQIAVSNDADSAKIAATPLAEAAVTKTAGAA